MCPSITLYSDVPVCFSGPTRQPGTNGREDYLESARLVVSIPLANVLDDVMLRGVPSGPGKDLKDSREHLKFETFSTNVGRTSS